MTAKKKTTKKTTKKATTKKAPAVAETKEVALVGQGDYGVSADLASEMSELGMGAGEQIDSMDITIPKLMLTQGLTKAVAKGKARVGTYINSVTLEEMGDNVEALVIQSYKVWQEYRVVQNGKDEYLQTIDYYGNEDLPYQFQDEQGNPCTRKQVLGFYVLLMDEIKSGTAFPYIIDFKGASKGAGRTLSTHFAKLRSNNLPSFAKVFSFGSDLVEDEYTYYVKTVDMGRAIEREELQAVKHWITELKKNQAQYKVDDSEEVENNDGVVEAEVISSTSKSKF